MSGLLLKDQTRLAGLDRLMGGCVNCELGVWLARTFCGDTMQKDGGSTQTVWRGGVGVLNGAESVLGRRGRY